MAENAEHSEGHGKSHKHKGGHGGHGGGHEEGHEGAPEWLISFADMVMLMMGFFVILFALNVSPDDRKQTGGSSDETTQGAQGSDAMLDFAIALREAFNNPVDLESNAPQDQKLVNRLKQRAGRSETRDPGLKGHEQDVQSIRPSEYYAVSGSVPFGEGSIELNAQSKAIINDVAAKVKGLNLVVEVRGHVSAVEAADGPEASMKLSAERAQAVAHVLAEQGVQWWQMRLVLCADSDRVEAHPATRDADKANARVEIIITDEVVPDRVPTRYGA